MACLMLHKTVKSQGHSYVATDYCAAVQPSALHITSHLWMNLSWPNCILSWPNMACCQALWPMNASTRGSSNCNCKTPT